MCSSRFQVDDTTEIKNIYLLALKAVRSIVHVLEEETDTESLYSLLESEIPIDLGMWAKLPAITSLKVSILELLDNDELPSLQDLYYTYRYFKSPYYLLFRSLCHFFFYIITCFTCFKLFMHF